MFPVAVEAGIDHAWCGVLGVPRDWCATVKRGPAYRPRLGGRLLRPRVAAANLAGRTLADLVRGVPSPRYDAALGRSPLAALGARARALGRGARALRAIPHRGPAGIAHRFPRTSVLARAGDLISGIPH